MRGAFPGDERPTHDPIGHLELVAERRRLPRRPGLGEHDREARRRDLRLDAHHLLPRLHRAAAGRPGDERPHVRRRRDPGQPRDARASAACAVIEPDDGRARLARRARRRPAARARRACWPRSRRRCRRAAGPGTACGCWSPPAAPASRSTRCASSATARAGGWASPSPRPRRAAGAEVTLVAANVALPLPRRRRRRSRSRRPPSSPTRVAGEVRRPPRAADGGRAGRLPRRRAGRRQDRARGTAGIELRLEPTEDILAARRRPARATGPDAGRLRRRDRRGRDRARPGEARAQGRRRDRLQRRLARRDRLRLDRQRGHDRRARAASITCRWPPRTRSPRRSSTGSRRSAAAVQSTA